MTEPLAWIHRLYVDYVDRLNEDVASDPRPMIQRLGRLTPMSLAEFAVCWQSWGQSPDLQQAWLRKFESGYEKTANEERDRIREAIRFSPKKAQRRAG